MKQLTLDLTWDASSGLDRFVAGANGMALAHLRQALAAPALPQVPTYVWGEPSSGKTHLLQAVRIALQQRGLHVGWLDATVPCAAGAAPEFDPNWQAIVLDDVDRFDAAQQHTAFNWFVHAQTPANGGGPRWVLAAGRLPVTDLALREDLRTRLGWGQVLALQLLSDVEVKQALQAAARHRGLTLGEEVVDYMQRRFARDTGSLMALLHLLDEYALQNGRAITIPLIRQMLDETLEEAKPQTKPQATPH